MSSCKSNCSAKFSSEVQRHVLRQEQQLPPNTKWSTEDLLAAARAHIRAERKIIQHTPKRESERLPLKNESNRRTPQSTKATFTCFYCNKPGHSPKQCQDFRSRDERIELIKRKNLCRNCGAPGHQATHCSKGACRMCNEKGHHTSICKKATFTKPTPITQVKGSSNRPQPQENSKPKSPRKTVTTRTHCVSSEEVDNREITTDTVLHVGNSKRRPDTLILVGEALNQSTRALSLQKTRSSFARTTSHSPSVLQTSQIRADILLGCADLFTLLEEDVGQQRTLPSGLKILPSKLGYLVIGKVAISNNNEPVAVSKAESAASSGTELNLLLQNKSHTADEISAKTVADHILIECAKQDTQMATSTTIATTHRRSLRLSVHDVLLNNTPLQDEGAMDSEADCATRGLQNEELSQHFWWNGPDFISTPLEEWNDDCRLFSIPDEEMEVNNCVVTVCKTLDSTSSRSTVLEKIQEVCHHVKLQLRYVLRFIKGISSRVDKNLRARIEQHIPELSQMTTEPYVTANEREMALRALIRNHQQVHVQDSRRNVLKQLKLQADSHGILRCRGRLDKTSLEL
ncbi:zinc knuckle [Ostertagia ostertagi]